MNIKRRYLLSALNETDEEISVEIMARPADVKSLRSCGLDVAELYNTRLELLGRAILDLLRLRSPFK